MKLHRFCLILPQDRLGSLAPVSQQNRGQALGMFSREQVFPYSTQVTSMAFLMGTRI